MHLLNNSTNFFNFSIVVHADINEITLNGSLLHMPYTIPSFMKLNKLTTATLSN